MLSSRWGTGVARSYALILMMLLMAGCAVAPKKIDTSDSQFRLAGTDSSNRPVVNAIEIKNDAVDGEYERDGLFGEQRLPCIFDPMPRKLVEEDMKTFFDAAVRVDRTSQRKLVVNLKRVKCYGVLSAIKSVPFVGLALVATDNPLVMEVNALLEIEENGHVVSSYLLDKKTTIVTKTTFEEDVDAAHKALISEYRSQIYDELRNNFVKRYLGQ